MRYDEYKAKLIKRRQVTKKILKFLWAYILAFVLIVSGIFLLLSFVGTPQNVSSFEIESGDTPTLNAKTFLNTKYDIEYETKDGYSTTPELIPGEYQFRVIGHGVFGDKVKYYKYKVNKKPIEIKINETEIEYGKNPTAYVDINDISVTCDYEYESLYLANTKVKADISTVKLVDKDNNDMLIYYEPYSNYQDITFTQCPLKIEISNSTKVFDGTPLTTSEYKVTSKLFYMDKVEATLEGSQTYVGTSDITLKSVVVYDVNGNVVENYRAEYTPGTLEVTEATQKVITSSESKEYDGTSLTGTITNEPLVGKFVIDTQNSITYYGSIPNEITPKVVENDNDITYCYNFVYEYGNLTITSTKLNILVSDTYSYTGTALKLSTYSITAGELYNNDTIKIISSGSKTNAGEYNNINVEYDIINTDDVSVLKSYDVVLSTKLVINPSEITIKPKNLSREYNREKLVYSETDYIVSGYVYERDKIAVEFDLPSDETLTNPGKFKVGISSYSIYKGAVSTSDNYKVTKLETEVEITKIKLEIVSENVTVEYDRETHGLEVFDYKGNLLDGDTISYSGYDKYKDIGNHKITVTGVIYNGYDNVSDYYEITTHEYSVTINQILLNVTIINRTITYDGKSHTFTNDDIIVKGNMFEGDTLEINTNSFKDSITNAGTLLAISMQLVKVSYASSDMGYYRLAFSENFASLKIVKRNITLLTGSITETYKQNVALTCHEYEIIQGKLPEGYKIEIVYTGSLSSVGKKKNSIESYIIRDENGKDVTSNFNVTIEEGDLEYVFKNE